MLTPLDPCRRPAPNDVSKHRAGSTLSRAALRTPTAKTTFANLLILGGNAVAGIVSARALGPSGRGQLAVVILWTAMIHMLGSLGLLSSCSYHVARWPERRPALCRWFSCLAARQAVGMTVVSAALLTWLHFRLHLAPVLTIEYMTWAGAATITLYGTCYVQGLGDFRRFNLIRVIPGTAPALVIIAIAIAVRLTPAEAGAAYLLPIWCSAFLAWAWLRRPTKRPLSLSLTSSERHSLWSYGWRSLASFSGLTLNRSADQLALGLLVPVGTLGLYSVAVAASSPLPSLVASFGMVGLPTVTALRGRAKARATWTTLRRAVYLLVILSPPLAIVLPRAIPLVYGTQYATAIVPAEVLLVGAVFAALASVADDLLRAHGYPGFVSLSQGAGGIVTLIGTMLLGGHPLLAVALVSALGYLISFVLALVRLTIATQQLRLDRHLGEEPAIIEYPVSEPRRHPRHAMVAVLGVHKKSVQRRNSQEPSSPRRRTLLGRRTLSHDESRNRPPRGTNSLDRR
jgi:O-antigen/teichoic acid export membrane protein